MQSAVEFTLGINYIGNQNASGLSLTNVCILCLVNSTQVVNDLNRENYRFELIGCYMWNQLWQGEPITVDTAGDLESHYFILSPLSVMIGCSPSKLEAIGRKSVGCSTAALCWMQPRVKWIEICKRKSIEVQLSLGCCQHIIRRKRR